MTNRDVVVFVPLLPGMAVIATWCLPWEQWLPKYVSKKILGPYLLYVSFAAWYFGVPWRFVLIALVLGTVLSVMAAVEIIQDNRKQEPEHSEPQEQNPLTIPRHLR